MSEAQKAHSARCRNVRCQEDACDWLDEQEEMDAASAAPAPAAPAPAVTTTSETAGATTSETAKIPKLPLRRKKRGGMKKRQPITPFATAYTTSLLPPQSPTTRDLPVPNAKSTPSAAPAPADPPPAVTTTSETAGATTSETDRCREPEAGRARSQNDTT
jgi:hypothetical protein